MCQKREINIGSVGDASYTWMVGDYGELRAELLPNQPRNKGAGSAERFRLDRKALY